jgi:hypothetical protein
VRATEAERVSEDWLAGRLRGPIGQKRAMHSTYGRVYNIFYMGVTTICVVAGFGALLALLYGMDAPVDFDVVDITNFRFSQRQFEEAQLVFDIDADLMKLIHVNTRLYYSYILAEWGNTSTDRHSSILWNHLIKREQPHFVAKGLAGNFSLRQVGPSIKGKTINLSLCIQQVPFVGFFRTKKLLTKSFTFPGNYVTSRT